MKYVFVQEQSRVSKASSLAHRCSYAFHTPSFDFYLNPEREFFMSPLYITRAGLSVVPGILREPRVTEFKVSRVEMYTHPAVHP